MKTNKENLETLLSSHEAGIKIYAEHARFWLERGMFSKARYFEEVAADYKEKAEAVKKEIANV